MALHSPAEGRFVPPVDARPDDVRWPEMAWPPRRGTVLAGAVIELRPTDPESDAEELFGCLDDDRVWAHLAGRPASIDGLVGGLRARQAAGFFCWTVRLRMPYAGLPAGAVVGTTAYLEVAPADARLEIGATAYAPAVWASAVNPECKLLLLSHAFEELGAGRVQLKTDVRNHRSQQAIARLGARYEGILRRYQRRSDGTVRDTVLFSVVAEEWPEVRDGLVERVAAAR